MKFRLGSRITILFIITGCSKATALNMQEVGAEINPVQKESYGIWIANAASSKQKILASTNFQTAVYCIMAHSQPPIYKRPYQDAFYKTYIAGFVSNNIKQPFFGGEEKELFACTW
jgi:hypothetical protein